MEHQPKFKIISDVPAAAGWLSFIGSHLLEDEEFDIEDAAVQVRGESGDQEGEDGIGRNDIEPAAVRGMMIVCLSPLFIILCILVIY